MGLEVVLLLLSEPALLDALVVGVLGLEVDAPAALQESGDRIGGHPLG